MKNQNGITLIALVVTIIVLLILAGVAIAMLSGDNGVLNKATESVEYNKIGEVKDDIGLAVNEAMATYYDYKYNKITLDTSSSDLPSAIIDAIKGTDATAKSVIEATVQTFDKNNGDDKNKPTNGAEVEFNSPTITITSGNCSVTGTISNDDKGTITWGNIE